MYLVKYRSVPAANPLGLTEFRAWCSVSLMIHSVPIPSLVLLKELAAYFTHVYLIGLVILSQSKSVKIWKAFIRKDIRIKFHPKRESFLSNSYPFQTLGMTYLEIRFIYRNGELCASRGFYLLTEYLGTSEVVYRHYYVIINMVVWTLPLRVYVFLIGFVILSQSTSVKTWKAFIRKDIRTKFHPKRESILSKKPASGLVNGFNRY